VNSLDSEGSFVSPREGCPLLRVIGAVCVALAVAATPLLAQSNATVSGVVKDASGGVLPGALVEAVVAGRPVAAVTTAENGRYELPVAIGVPVAVRVTLQGFADEVVELPGSAGPVTRDITLQIGRVSDTLVVTGSRTPISRASVTQSVTVATKADIEALGSSSLADVIRYVPGVNIEGTGREGSATSMFSRGGESDYNLVLIDGVRANANGGFYDFGRLSAGEIERVEVVRGAQSSLWGSDAMGAVVQVFTRRAGVNDAPSVSGSVEGGSFDTWRGDARISGGARRRIDYHAGASHRRTNGAFADILPEDDKFEQSSWDAGMGVTLANRVSLRTSLRATRGMGVSVGNLTYGALDTGGSYDTEDWSWPTEIAHTLGRRFTGTANINYFYYSSTSIDRIADPPFTTHAILEGTPNALFPNGTRLVRLIDQAEFDRLAAAGATPGPGQFLASRASSDFASAVPSITELERPAVRYQGDFTWGGGHRLSAGYEWEREHRRERTTPPVVLPFTLDNNAFFVQQQFSFLSRWFVTAGVRSDAKESLETFYSPKLSAGGFVVPARRGGVSSLKVFGNIGRGIKTPSFGERFGSGFADPNPDLKVEQARTADLGVEATFADQRFRTAVTYFDNSYKDQIAFRSSGAVGDGIPEFINIDGSKADGWELEAALQRPVAGFSASGSYSLVDTRVVTNVSTSQQFQPGQPLLRRPKHSGVLRAGYTYGRLSVGYDVRVVGDRHDNSFLGLRTVPNAARPTAITTDITVNPGYAVSGLNVDFRVADEVTLFLRANNLGDEAYDSALGYPGSPRSFMAGARFNVRAGR
jgi:vitamin B12 transporter